MDGLGRISGFYPNGRPSGLPGDIIEQLVNAKKMEELDPVQKDLEEVKSQKDVYTRLNSQLVNLVKATESLNNNQVFQVKNASSSDEEVITANVVGQPKNGSYTVNVDQTAQAHNHVIGVDDNDSNTGVTLGIEDPDDASLINEEMKISFYHKSNEYKYITNSETTLNSLAQTISDDSNGITANVTNIGTTDSPEYVMTLKSDSTGGGENLITKDGDTSNVGVQITDTTSSGNNLFSQGAAEQDKTKTGQNALFSVDGVNYERSSNEVSDVIDGIMLNLKDQGTNIDINVNLDTESVTKKVQSFIKVYNKTQAFIDYQSRYDAEKKEAGPLMGSSIARNAEMKMTSLLMQPISGTADNQYQYLSQVGFEFKQDGIIEFDSEAFSSAMAENPEDVENLFVGENGVAGKLEYALKGYTDNHGGAVSSKIDSIENRIDRINDKIQDEQEDIQNYRMRMTEKFSNMEEAIMKYQSIESQLNNWLDLGKDKDK